MYEDFNNPDKPNSVWGWVKDGEEWKWSYEHLEFVCAGDTDSAMFNAETLFPPDSDEDDVVFVSDEIGSMVNQTFPDFCKFAFNVPDDRKDTIQTDREVVFDKALFLSKKRYIMSIVNNEGQKVNKLKIQGVEIKKSDTSKAVKEMLVELVNMILDGKEMDDVLLRIREMKVEYRELPLSDIVTPCNTKTLSKVNKTFEATGSLKGCHYSAKAAFHWNRMKTPQDQEVYAGQKVGLVYVKHKDFNCIGYPIDLQTLPDWFIQIPIDYDTMWSKANKKLTNYLASMGWDIESRKETARKELFGF